MDINIYVNQKKINPLYQNAVSEYIKRLTPYCRLSIVCAPSKIKFSSGKNTASFAICDNGGCTCKVTISSEDYAAAINSLTSNGISRINYYIGYPEDDTCDMETFSICTLSPGAEMTSVLLAEQIYRAYTILNHITYHK